MRAQTILFLSVDGVKEKLDCRPYRGRGEGNPKKLVEAASRAFPTLSIILTIRRLFSLGNRNLLYLHIRTHLGPVVLQQLGLNPLYLEARCAHQILSTPCANRRQILLAHDPTIHHPDAPRLTVLTLHHAQNRFHGGHVSTIAIERLIAERKSLAVDDQRDPHWFTVRAVIARVSPAHPRVVLRRPFHVAAGQVVKQHIKLGTE